MSKLNRFSDLCGSQRKRKRLSLWISLFQLTQWHISPDSKLLFSSQIHRTWPWRARRRAPWWRTRTAWAWSARWVVIGPRSKYRTLIGQCSGGRQPRGGDHLAEGGRQARAGQLPRPRYRRCEQVGTCSDNRGGAKISSERLIEGIQLPLLALFNPLLSPEFSELTPGPTPAPPPTSWASPRPDMWTWRLTVSRHEHRRQYGSAVKLP